jgi:predicted nuclease of restriction endonuclease-like (RecB) superfamily
LSWSHYLELLKIDEDLERNFYEKQAILENWSIRELKRMKNSMLFHRLALSTDKEGVLRLSQEGKIVETPEDMLREPYILEFLNISQEKRITELELERKLIQHFQDFLLELGKGFAYIGRQYRITIANHHYYVDLVFYHRILKCFVLIDLKMGAADHADVGQMNLYLNYFLKEENVSDDNPPIGIISKCNEKKDNFMQCCCSVCKRP